MTLNLIALLLIVVLLGLAVLILGMVEIVKTLRAILQELLRNH